MEVDPLIGWCLTYSVNFCDHPAASIPAGLADEQLPVGMQLIGRRYGDADVARRKRRVRADQALAGHLPALCE